MWLESPLKDFRTVFAIVPFSQNVTKNPRKQGGSAAEARRKQTPRCRGVAHPDPPRLRHIASVTLSRRIAFRTVGLLAAMASLAFLSRGCMARPVNTGSVLGSGRAPVTKHAAMRFPCQLSLLT